MLHLLQTPLSYCPFVLAEHSLARAGNVGKDDVKLLLALAEVLGITVCHDVIRVSPFGDILLKHLCASSYRLVADKSAALRKHATRQRRFTPWGSTEVEHNYGLRDILP